MSDWKTKRCCDDVDEHGHDADYHRACLRIAELETENKRLREALEAACEAVKDWGAYASEYFQQKWNWKADCEPATHIQTATDNIAVRKAAE